MKSRLRISARLSLVTIAVIACGQSACRKASIDLVKEFAASFARVVKVPPLDLTPPSVSLTIPQGSGKIILTSTSAPLQMPLDRADSFFIIAAAEDPEGVKEVGFVGESVLQCEDGSGYVQHAYIVGPSAIDEAGPGGQAMSRRWLPRLVDDSFLRCPSGLTLVSASLTLRAKGRNFSGGEGHSAAATFTWSP